MKNVNETLENLRQSYQLKKLDIDDCHINPFTQFQEWLDEAIKAGCDEPNAFILSTVHEGQPRGRALLLKGIIDGGLVFYTNYQSSKGHEIQDQQKVSMTFLWLPLQRQIRVEGVALKTSKETSDSYFHKRPRGSQLGAIASPQSSPLKSRKELEDIFDQVETKFQGVEILPRPDHWGGYKIVPQYFEFWQGRNNRMHDRINYLLESNQWKLSRLAP